MISNANQKKTRAVKSDCDFFLVPYGVFCEILIPMRRLGEWVLLRNSRRLALGEMDGLIVARTYLQEMKVAGGIDADHNDRLLVVERLKSSGR